MLKSLTAIIFELRNVVALYLKTVILLAGIRYSESGALLGLPTAISNVGKK